MRGHSGHRQAALNPSRSFRRACLSHEGPDCCLGRQPEQNRGCPSVLGTPGPVDLLCDLRKALHLSGLRCSC